VLQRSARTRQELPGVWLEALVLAAGYTLYQFVQILVVGSRRSAVDRASWLWSTEQHLHVDPEVWLNHFVAERYGLVVVTGLHYGILHFAVTPLVLVKLRARRPDRYVSLRNTLVGTSMAGVTICGACPLSPYPPRMVERGHA
jgi:PAP2 superfamily